MRLALWIILTLALAPGAPAHEKCSKADCEKIRQKIKQIQSKMRQGYTASQGEKLEADLRKDRALRARQCR